MLLAHYENNIIPYELNHNKILNDRLKAFFRYLESFQTEQTKRDLPFFRYVIEVNYSWAPWWHRNQVHVSKHARQCRWWKSKINCWRATCSSEHSSYQAHPSGFCNAQSVCTGLEAGLHDLFGSLLFLHRAARVCSVVQDVQWCFIGIPHFAVAAFSLNLALYLLLVRDVPNGHSSSRVPSPSFCIALSSYPWLDVCSWPALCCRRGDKTSEWSSATCLCLLILNMTRNQICQPS